MNADRFQAEVLEADMPVLVDFTAPWCPPCRMMDPIVAAIDAEREDVKVVKVDVDESLDISGRYGVLSMPTFMLFVGGEPVVTLVGARPRHRLEQELDAALAPVA